MYEYKLSFEGLPKTCWACYAENENYSWDSTAALKNNTLEIGFIQAKEHVRVINGERHVFKDAPPLLCCVTRGDGSSGSAEPGVLVTTTTVAVQFPKLIVDSGEVTTADYTNSPMLILPRYLDNCPEEFIADIKYLLNRYISANAVNSVENRLTCLSLFFEILAKIDSHVRNRFLRKNEKSYHYYVKKVNSIINERYATKISQQEIAKELGISSSYLSALYKQATGLSFSQYLLQTRMKHAMELLASSNMTTAQLAAAVGFDAESHFRRRFKEYAGINIREYRYIQREMTLYHSKPTRPSKEDDT